MTPFRARIIASAKEWLGTPYRHQASARGAGCDCLGLVRGVWREAIGPEPTPLPPYTPHWAEGAGEPLIEAFDRFLVPRAEAAAGDVLVFRMAEGGPAKHAAILLPQDVLIHAYWARAVVESRFAPWWRRRLVAAYAFPGAE